MKLKVKNVKRVFKNAKDVFKNVGKSKAFLEKSARFLKNRIQAQTRSGRDLVNDRAQPALSKNYVAYRESVMDGTSGDGVRPDKRFMVPSLSNLTLTGQLLKSMKYELRSRLRRFDIFVSGLRKDGSYNSNVAKDLKDRGRVFLGVDENGILRIKKNLLDDFRRLIKQKRFKKR